MSKPGKGKRYEHGGGRVLTGVYLTKEESYAYTKACELEGITKSAQGVKLLTTWTQRKLKKVSQ